MGKLESVKLTWALIEENNTVKKVEANNLFISIN